MPTLLVYEPTDQESSEGTLFGGRPFVPAASAAAFVWPVCRTCRNPMQFLGRLMIPAVQDMPRHHILLFQCHNQPGMCFDSAPDDGGNLALMVPEGPVLPINPPPHPEVLRPKLYGAVTVYAEPDNYRDAMMAWLASTGRPDRDALGQLLGNPQWIQLDETPFCSTCAKPMKFVARLESYGEDHTYMNFGGGSAYVFECPCGVAKFLWQC